MKRPILGSGPCRPCLVYTERTRCARRRYSQAGVARSTIQPVCDEGRLRQQALQDGLRPLRLAGAMKVAEGVTTLDEVLRATPAWE